MLNLYFLFLLFRGKEGEEKSGGSSSVGKDFYDFLKPDSNGSLCSTFIEFTPFFYCLEGKEGEERGLEMRFVFHL